MTRRSDWTSVAFPMLYLQQNASQVDDRVCRAKNPEDKPEAVDGGWIVLVVEPAGSHGKAPIKRGGIYDALANTAADRERKRSQRCRLPVPSVP